MHYTLTQDTFFVTELLSPQMREGGEYHYYLIEKKGMSHKQLLRRLPKDTLFSGIKDKNATTVQWCCTKNAIDDIDEENLHVHFMGNSKERIHIGMHPRNAFKILVTLSPKEFAVLKKFNEKKELICNYFGPQRFSVKSRTVATAITKGEYESALKTFLCAKTLFDTEKSTAMKKSISEQWGNWKAISEHELIKDTGKKVLFEYLKNNPADFNDAFLYAEPKSVKQLVKSMQALRWNDLLAKETLIKKPANLFATIAQERMALCATKAMKRELAVEATAFEKQFFKKTLTRKTFFAVKKFSIKKGSTSNSNQYWLHLELPKGSYATVFLKYLEAKLGQEQSI